MAAEQVPVVTDIHAKRKPLTQTRETGTQFLSACTECKRRKQKVCQLLPGTKALALIFPNLMHFPVTIMPFGYVMLTYILNSVAGIGRAGTAALGASPTTASSSRSSK